MNEISKDIRCIKCDAGMIIVTGRCSKCSKLLMTYTNPVSNMHKLNIVKYIVKQMKKFMQESKGKEALR